MHLGVRSGEYACVVMAQMGERGWEEAGERGGDILCREKQRDREHKITLGSLQGNEMNVWSFRRLYMFLKRLYTHSCASPYQNAGNDTHRDYIYQRVQSTTTPTTTTAVVCDWTWGINPNRSWQSFKRDSGWFEDMKQHVMSALPQTDSIFSLRKNGVDGS